MLCGDEIKAGIIDIGSSFVKVGTSGQDLPRHVFKTDFGVIEENGKSRPIIGDVGLRNFRPDVDIVNPISENGINWEYMEYIIQHSIDCLGAEPQVWPLFLSESTMKSKQDKSKICEILFESIGTPAMYMTANAVLSSFSGGRPTSLLIDIGGSGFQITPVIDGYCLRKSQYFCERGGNWVDSLIQNELQHRNINIKLWYENFSSYRNEKSSYRNLHTRDIIRDVKQWMCFVPYAPLAEDTRNDFFTQKIAIPPYILPDGTSINMSDSLCSIPESVYFPNTMMKRPLPQPVIGLPSFAQPLEVDFNSCFSKESTMETSNQSLATLVHACICRCDVDIRRDLLQNIMVVGGAALTDGIMQRLLYELGELFPGSVKAKTVSQLPLERQFSTWIGGSILSICGSFQQLWLSRKEYEEGGDRAIFQRLEHCSE